MSEAQCLIVGAVYTFVEGGFPMASNSRDASQAVQDFLDRAPSEMPDLGDPLTEEDDDPLLDRDRIELDEEQSE